MAEVQVSISDSETEDHGFEELMYDTEVLQDNELVEETLPSENKQDLQVCPVNGCEQVWRNPKANVQHWVRHHVQNIRMYACPCRNTCTCFYASASQWNVRRHTSRKHQAEFSSVEDLKKATRKYNLKVAEYYNEDAVLPSCDAEGPSDGEISEFYRAEHLDPVDFHCTLTKVKHVKKEKKVKPSMENLEIHITNTVGAPESLELITAAQLEEASQDLPASDDQPQEEANQELQTSVDQPQEEPSQEQAVLGPQLEGATADEEPQPLVRRVEVTGQEMVVVQVPTPGPSTSQQHEVQGEAEPEANVPQAVPLVEVVPLEISSSFTPEQAYHQAEMWLSVARNAAPLMRKRALERERIEAKIRRLERKLQVSEERVQALQRRNAELESQLADTERRLRAADEKVTALNRILQ